MSSSSDWEMPQTVQPKPENYAYNLEGALTSLVGLRAIIPADAFTADTLGTERSGNGVLIRDGVVLTIGYLVVEAEGIEVIAGDGKAVPATLAGYDHSSGFGLLRLVAPIDARIQVLGPAEAPLAVIKGRYRFRILVKSLRNVDLSDYLREWLAAGPKTKGNLKLEVDVDPQSFL